MPKKKQSDLKDKIRHLNWYNKEKSWIVVPFQCGQHKGKRLKELDISKNNLFFSKDMPKGLIDFSYRAIIQLKLSEKKIFFKRGTIRSKGHIIHNRARIELLDWDVGIVITIPKSLRLKDTIELSNNNKILEVKKLELVILHGLLQLAFRQKSQKWYINKTHEILLKGWKVLEI